MIFMSRKLLYSLLLSLCCLPAAFAQQKQKFTIESFERDLLDLSARDPHYEKRDGSGARYAIIKVRATNPEDDLSAYNFNFGMLDHKVEERDGVLWVYVQCNAKRVNVTREGYFPIHDYDLQTTIEEGANYKMTISTEARRVYSQMVRFNVTPADANAVVTMYGTKQDSLKVYLEIDARTGSVAKAFEYGTYHYEVIASDYYTSRGSFTLGNKDLTHEETINLRANFANITLIGQNRDSICINGEFKGILNWTGKLASGDYTIECRAKNHTTASKTISVQVGNDQTITLPAAVPITGTLSITSVPLEADISIDGESYGQTPKNVEIVIGNHLVTVSKQGYEPASQTVWVNENEMSELNPTLNENKNECNVTINSVPQGALLYIDGMTMGSTPYTGRLKFGLHTIALYSDDYETFRQVINIESSKPEYYTFGLTKAKKYEVKVKRSSKIKDAWFYSDIEPNQFYCGLSADYTGKTFGVGFEMGGFINNWNIEGSSLIHPNCGMNPVGSSNDEISYISLGFKFGYGFTVSSKIRLTPQIGVKWANYYAGGDEYNYTDVDEYGENNWCATFGIRAEWAFSDIFCLALTPEASVAVIKNDIFWDIAKESKKMKALLTGIGVRLGIYLTL